jgi:hypothetical protein
MRVPTYQEDTEIDVGGVIRRGFGVIGRNAGGYVLVALLLTGLPNFIMEYGGSLSFGDNGASWMGLSGLVGFLGLFSGFVLQAAVLRSSVLDLGGQPAELGASLQSALRLLLPMIGLAIVMSVAVIVASMLLLVPGVMLYVAWIVAVPVLVEEQPGVFASLSRSVELTSGSRWRIFGLLLIYLAAWCTISAILENFAPERLGSPFLYSIVTAAATTISALLAAVMLASLYVELRTVKEGATTDSLAAIFA